MFRLLFCDRALAKKCNVVFYFMDFLDLKLFINVSYVYPLQCKSSYEVKETRKRHEKVILYHN